MNDPWTELAELVTERRLSELQTALDKTLDSFGKPKAPTPQRRQAPRRSAPQKRVRAPGPRETLETKVLHNMLYLGDIVSVKNAAKTLNVPAASLRRTLAKLVREGRVQSPQRGHYQRV